METGLRYLATVGLAIVITLSAFFLMHKLIDQSATSAPVLDPVHSIRFGPIDIPEPPKPEPKPPPERPDPPDPPPPTDRMVVSSIDQSQLPPTIDPVPHNDGVGNDILIGRIRGPGDQTDGDAHPLVTVPPPYPRKAALEGIEGWVRLEVRVGADGLVRNVRVLASSPPRVFDDAAIRAVRRWKWKPQVVAGVPADQTVVQELKFSLDNL